MENLKNKRVRLRNQASKTYLVACNDKISVNHIDLGNNKPKPDNSVWMIKSKHPEKSIRLESVYGKLLALKSGTEGLIVSQAERPPAHDKAAVERSRNWWVFEDVNQSGFTSVRVRLRLSTHHCACLHPDSNSQVIAGIRKESYWWISWLVERLYTWDLEIVEDPIIDPSHPRVIISNNNSEDDPPILPTLADGIPPATTYTYQIERMYIYQDAMAGTSFPFYNSANSGRNVNKSGTQIVGAVSVQTHIDNMVNKKIVKRTS